MGQRPRRVLRPVFKLCPMWKRISVPLCTPLAVLLGVLTQAAPQPVSAQGPQAQPAAPAAPVAPTPPAALPAGTRSITWTEPELNEALAKRFPQQRSLHGLLQITLSQPHVQLLPSANRLRTSVRLRLAEPFTGQAYEGDVQLLHGLRYEPGDRSLRMTGVQVEQLNFPGVPEPYRQVLREQGAPLVAQALSEQPLYTAKQEQTALLDGLGFAIGELQVTPKGLRVLLTPTLSAPAVEAPIRP